MVYKRVCITCNTEFETNHPKYLNCSKECNSIYRVNQRYKRENNDWQRYFKHLLSTKKGHTLTVAELVGKIAEQNYKCALSGVELTCNHERGNIIQTNASIDRINAGEEYNYNNIQLVCRAINSFRGNLSIEEFKFWCEEVVKNAIQK